MFEHFTCWDGAGATKILRPLALEGNEAVFRATHSPISGLVVTGSEAHDVSRSTEEGLLDALSSGDRRHAMCIVEGEAGSGKSHLIRWLKVNWPGGHDLPILVERADGTLDGTLRQLNEKLSMVAGWNSESLVPRHKLTEQGLRDSLLHQLGTLCRSGNLAEPLGDEEWCEKHGLADMLQSQAVRAYWKAPGRILETLTLGADRDSKLARFAPRDVLELKQALAGLKGKIVGPGAIRLAQRLLAEAAGVASALEGYPPESDEADVSTVAPDTTRLLAALNLRLGLAIQSVIGINGAALQKMFRQLRRTLRVQGRRLVLLLEDLTGAQGVDQELLYVLQEKSTTQDQLCDLVSVIGITPAYFRQHISSQANVVQRITHHVRFGKAEGSFQTVAAIGEPAVQAEFASRYLRAVRAGMAEIDQASREHREVANRCETCLHREDCHAAFGAVGGVGLYPLSPKAIERMFRALKDPRGTMLLQTPRQLIQAVIMPSVSGSAETAIHAGRFPIPSVETEWHPSSKREVEGTANELIEKTPERYRDQLRMTVAWWGEGRFPLAGDAPGEWAGVREGIFHAWGIPLPAKVEASVPPPAQVTPKTAAQPQPPGAGMGASVAAPPLGGTPLAKETAKPGKKTSPKTPVEEQLERLRLWRKTSKIEDDGFWSDRAAAFIRQVGWKNEDTSHWFTDDALGEVRLHGSGKTDPRNVVIPSSEWAVRGLEWSARLEFGKVSQVEHEFAIQAMAAFAHNVREVVLKWIASRAPMIDSGTPWQFEATAVQVLLTRAWLRGETRPGAALVEQWKAILSDDSSSGATARPGALAWNRAVADLAADSQLRARLRKFAECDDIVANVALAAPAIRSLAEEGRFTPFPNSIPEQPIKTKWLVGLASSAEIANRALTDLPEKEVARLRGRATAILDIAGQTGFAVYVERAVLAFEKVRLELPDHSPGELSAWFRMYDLTKRFLRPAPGSERDNLQEFLVGRSWETLLADAPSAALLDHAIVAPAEPLEVIGALVKDTGALVNALVGYLEQHTAGVSAPKDASAVVDFGAEIERISAQYRSAIL